MNAKNHEDDISYKLLDELDRESMISQRALADRLGIALGLVNTYIKRLCNKGYIKIKWLPRNRIKYIITPQGFTEKSRLAYKYMQYSILFFKDVRNKIEETYSIMIRRGIKRILLWGDGELAEICFISTRGYPLEVIGAVGGKEAEKGFFGCTVYTPETFTGSDFDAVLVATLDQSASRDLQKAAVPEEKIFYLDHQKGHGN